MIAALQNKGKLEEGDKGGDVPNKRTVVKIDSAKAPEKKSSCCQ